MQSFWLSKEETSPSFRSLHFPNLQISVDIYREEYGEADLLNFAFGSVYKEPSIAKAQHLKRQILNR